MAKFKGKIEIKTNKYENEPIIKKTFVIISDKGTILIDNINHKVISSLFIVSLIILL